MLSRGRVYADSHLSNAFMTWVEPFDDEARSALGVPHMRIDEFGEVVHLGPPAGWLQVVHGGNVSNKVRGRRVSAAAARDRFAPAALGALDEAGEGAIALENAVLGPIRAARDALLALRQKARRMMARAAPR